MKIDQRLKIPNLRLIVINVCVGIYILIYNVGFNFVYESKFLSPSCQWTNWLPSNRASESIYCFEFYFRELHKPSTSGEKILRAFVERVRLNSGARELDVTCESQVSEGSTFEIYVPRNNVFEVAVDELDQEEFDSRFPIVVNLFGEGKYLHLLIFFSFYMVYV